MSNPALNNQISYIEFTTSNIERTRIFYTAVFGWTFQDWGPDYIGFQGAGIDGGFSQGQMPEPTLNAAPLVVLYSVDLQATQAAIVAAGGSIVVPTFEFPGGRRFHFSDGAGNVLAVWSE